MDVLRKIFILLSLSSSLAFASGADVHLEKAHIDLNDKPSLQRGAKLYMNYCSGCHSIKYMRYNRMAKDLDITTHDGQVHRDLLVNNLIFTQAKVVDPIHIAMPPKDAESWFGILPPDLSLIARVRGADWLYTYLTSFYRDAKRPFGVNNKLFPDVAMPNVLANLQGEQIAIWGKKIIPYNGSSKEIDIIDHLQLVQEGSMSEHQFERAVHDLVGFLVYVSDPIKTTRIRYGYWVIGFLLIFLLVVYLLKKDYWRELKK